MSNLHGELAKKLSQGFAGFDSVPSQPPPPEAPKALLDSETPLEAAQQEKVEIYPAYVHATLSYDVGFRECTSCKVALDLPWLIGEKQVVFCPECGFVKCGRKKPLPEDGKDPRLAQGCIPLDPNIPSNKAAHEEFLCRFGKFSRARQLYKDLLAPPDPNANVLDTLTMACALWYLPRRAPFEKQEDFLKIYQTLRLNPAFLFGMDKVTNINKYIIYTCIVML